MNRWKITLGVALVAAAVSSPIDVVQACSRVLYETGSQTYITGRSMDWNDPTASTHIWAFPRGMARDGGIGANPVKWTSKYGSVVASFYDAATADGMNEKGLVANLLYLAESDFGDPAKTGKPTLSVVAWAQYFLDNYATVSEAVGAMDQPAFTIIAPVLPNGRAATVHLSLSDATGDSAILEYINGELMIYHSRDYAVMTNSPVYDQQLALNAYWELIGGDRFLPGTISAADRFVRLSYSLKTSPKYKEPSLAVASVFSQMRAISVPIGMSDPNHPNIAMTLWRTVADHRDLVYYFEATISPTVVWVDLKGVDFSEGAGARKVRNDPAKSLAGEISAHFEIAEPYEWLGAQ